MYVNTLYNSEWVYISRDWPRSLPLIITNPFCKSIILASLWSIIRQTRRKTTPSIPFHTHCVPSVIYEPLVPFISFTSSNLPAPPFPRDHNRKGWNYFSSSPFVVKIGCWEINNIVFFVFTTSVPIVPWKQRGSIS